ASIGVLLLLAPLGALAQVAPEDYTLIGAAVRSRPAYDGSNAQTADLIPVLRYYGKPWFARTTQGVLEGGARWALGPGLDAGVQLAYEEGRKTSESDLLRGLGLADVDPGASIGAHLEWDFEIGPAPTSVLVRLRQHTDSDRGAQADLRLNVGLVGSGGFFLGAYAQATWASAKAVQSFYADSNAGSGLLHTSLGLLGSYDFARHWSAVAGAQARRLHGDAARSPITESESSYYFNAGLAYRL
ncbi:MAG TPA: MipA/OmpV family protein, partial [Burkholderiales bacterium]|nr:MipA/OmpV family protein [Burkholderiales bacterium]